MTPSNSTVRTFDLITPEGLEIRFTLAGMAERFKSLFIDMILIVLSLFLSVVVFFNIFESTPLIRSIFLLLTFFFLNGYFLFFELYWRGRTPGKRIVGLRVVSLNGGPLTTGAILARNLVRDLELFLPILAFVKPESIYGDLPGPIAIVTSLWILLFAFLPFFNRNVMRAGDFIAGTVVVTRPEGVLRQDLAAMKNDVAWSHRKDKYEFTHEQLDMYGIHELQVLEDLLRHDRTTGNRRRMWWVVGDKIRHKIGWTGTVERRKEYDFLKAFYRAQRRHLEQKLLLGERRKWKKNGILGDSPSKDVPPEIKGFSDRKRLRMKENKIKS